MRYAAANGFVLVTLDADFIELAAVLGSPPKLIWLRRGNQITEVVEQMLRDNAEAIAAFETDDAVCLEIY
jgi:predicted nuclease of predicted toxin-antitoxin system